MNESKKDLLSGAVGRRVTYNRRAISDSDGESLPEVQVARLQKEATRPRRAQPPASLSQYEDSSPSPDEQSEIPDSEMKSEDVDDSSY